MPSNRFRDFRSVIALCAALWNSAALSQTPTSPPTPMIDADRGKQLFQQNCSLCHAIDATTVTQGPRLNGVLGRTSASLPEFEYSDVLRRLQVTWDEKSLDRFLANPMLVAPGTTMPIGLPNASERRDVIAYLATLSPNAHAIRTAQAAAADDPGHWVRAKPGTRYRIEIDTLPAPYASAAAANFPRIVTKPAEAMLSAPDGFTVSPFATGLSGPRTIRVAPNGDVFVAETRSGRIVVLRATANGEAAQPPQIFASGLKQPFGMVFYPAIEPQWLYVANNNSVVRFAYRNGDLKARGREQTIVAQLSPTSGGHTTRDLAFSADGKQLFVSVGSASNVGEGMQAKTPDEAKKWQASMPLGAAWGSEAGRAAVLSFSPDGKYRKLFATGLRNCIGMAVEPNAHDLWCAVNERDSLGDNLVPDFATRVREKHFYGWPWYYLGKHEDPRLAGARPDLADKVTAPDVLLQAHSAPMHIAFYNATQGSSLFPVDYRGDAFVALHGSWNRSHRTGYKIVRLRLNAGVPTGEYEDFVTGFVLDDRSVWGRPAGIAVAHDGSLLFSDDASNTMWRVSYAGRAK